MIFFILGVFALMIAIGGLRYLQSMMPKGEWKKVIVAGGLLAGVLVFLAVVALTYAGVIAPWSGRYAICDRFSSTLLKCIVISGFIPYGTQHMLRFTSLSLLRYQNINRQRGFPSSLICIFLYALSPLVCGIVLRI